MEIFSGVVLALLVVWQHRQWLKKIRSMEYLRGKAEGHKQAASLQVYELVEGKLPNLPSGSWELLDIRVSGYGPDTRAVEEYYKACTHFVEGVRKAALEPGGIDA